MKKPSPPPVTFRQMNLAEAAGLGLEDMVHLQWGETMKDGVPLVIDWPEYRRMERMGRYWALAAMQGRRLIGYNAFIVQPTLHHATTTIAMNDVIYLDPEHRVGLTGLQLVTRAEKMLREDLKIRKIVYASKPYLNLGHGKAGGTLADLLRKLGYLDAETIHEKVF